MANITVKDAAAATKSLKTDGAGTDPDPHVPHHVVDALPNEGQQTMANSISVAVASDQSAVPVSGTVTANAGTGTRDVQGNLAHDAADGTSNPVKMGAKAVAHGASPTAVAAADRTDLYANRHGIPFVIGGHPNPFRVTRKDTAAQTDAILQAVAAGQKAVITAIAIYCDKANTVDVQALVEFDDVTDVRITEHPGIAAGSGIVEGNGAGILAVGTDGQDVLWTCEVPTTGSVTVQLTGFLIES